MLSTLHKQYCAVKEGGFRIVKHQKIKFFPMTDHRCDGKTQHSKWFLDQRVAVAGQSEGQTEIGVVIKDRKTKRWCWNMNPRAHKPEPIYLSKCTHPKPHLVNHHRYGKFVRGENWWQRFVWHSNGLVQSQVNLNNVGTFSGNAIGGNVFMETENFII